MKKINLKPESRLRNIMRVALLIQDTKIKKISQLRNLAHEIEILSNTDLLKKLNKGIEDFKKGRFTTLDKLKK